MRPVRLATTTALTCLALAAALPAQAAAPGDVRVHVLNGAGQRGHLGVDVDTGETAFGQARREEGARMVRPAPQPL